MKMEDLEKLAKKAEEIFKEREEKNALLKTACKAGLIKMPTFKPCFLSWVFGYHERHGHCPECGHKLTSVYKDEGLQYICPNCGYEYAC